jgi:Tfp pilus assembly protein PilN
MLRINLLPPYIYDKQKKVKYLVTWLAAVAVVLGVFLFWFVTLNKDLSDQRDLEAKATQLRTEFEKYDKDINGEKQARAQIEQRQTFIANAQKYNDSWPAAFETMRDVTAANILLKSMAFDKSRKVVSFTGFAKTETDIVKWWMYLRNNYAGPDASMPFDNVAFSLPPHPYAPQTAAAGGAGGPGGFGGSGGGSSSGGPMAMGGKMSEGGPSSSGGGGFSGSGGGPSGGGGGNNEKSVGPGLIEGRPGINFTASVVLKKPLADGIPVPTWPSGAAPAASGGFGGGGRPGGMPGSGGGSAN